MKFIRAVLESPYAGEVEKNRRFAISCMRDMLARGEAPFVPHLLYPQALQRYNEEARQKGIQAGQVWTEVGEICAVYLDYGLTEGMIQGIAKAESRGILVERRTLWPK